MANDRHGGAHLFRRRGTRPGGVGWYYRVDSVSAAAERISRPNSGATFLLFLQPRNQQRLEVIARIGRVNEGLSDFGVVVATCSRLASLGWTDECVRPYASISRWIQVRESAEFANIEIVSD